MESAKVTNAKTEGGGMKRGVKKTKECCGTLDMRAE